MKVHDSVLISKISQQIWKLFQGYIMLLEVV